MVAIKNMEMPKDCMECMFCNHIKSNDYGTYGECAILGDNERMNLLLHQKHSYCPLVEITEQDIVKPYLNKIKEEIMKLDDINPDYPMDRTIHISRNEVLQIINKCKAESEENNGTDSN